MFFKKKPLFIENDLESIIDACLSENQQAQRALFKMFFSYGKSISRRYASNEQEAEEIMNDSFLKMYKNLNRFDTSRSFKAWLKTIIINTSIDYYRKSISLRNAHQVLDINDVDLEDVNADVISKIATDELLNLIQRLTPSYRMVFTLYVIDGYNHREIAEMMGIKEGTSKSNLQDARHKLQYLIKITYPHLHAAYALKYTRINEN
jgi:RNA polymerase sigma-70 factor (ECF subfamily)